MSLTLFCRPIRRLRWRHLSGWALLLSLVLGLVPAGGILFAPQRSVAATGAPSSWPAGTWVMLDGRPVLEIRSAAGVQTPAAAARRASAALRDLAENTAIPPERLVVREEPPYSMVGTLTVDGRFEPRLAVDDRAGAAFGLSRQQVAEQYRDQLRGAIRQYRSSHSLASWLRGTALALLVLGVYLLWLRGQALLNRRLGRWIAQREPRLLGGLRLGGSRLLSAEQARSSLQLVRQLLHWLLLLLVSYLLIPLLLGLFPPTQGVAEGLRAHLLRVVSGLLMAVVNAIPNLLAILLILLLTRLAMQACRAWFAAIDRGQLQFSGFYREWARPTGRLVAAAILLAGLVIAYPYVPGSGSKVFQGAGLFVGVLAALGSSAVASNVISGLMLIYTRAFREGDRVDINGVVGVVQDRDLLVTRIQTPRNELVSLPNATVIAASITNFSFARREIQQPVAIATTITIGYDVPWRQVHGLLLEAARRCSGITDLPAPVVLQTALNDFHISYELNACLADVGLYRETLSELLGAIQDSFASADVEILSPGYQALRDGTPRTVPLPGALSSPPQPPSDPGTPP